MRHLLTLYLLVLFLPGFSLKRDVPATYSTIQSALNACSMGDTVLVQPGTYAENIYWPKTKNIKLFSAGDSSNTFIDANFVGRCLKIVDSTYVLIDTNTVIRGFRLVNGYSDTTTFNGTAIYSYGAKLTIEKCAITNCNVNAVNSNTASVLSGGVISFNIHAPTLRECALYGNSVYNSSGQIRGGLLYIGSSSFSLLNKINITNNQVSITSQATNLISGALIYAEAFYASNMRVLDNTVNYFGSSGATSFNAFLYGAGLSAAFSNCLIANNTFSASMFVNMKSLVILAPATQGPGNSTLTHLTIADNKAMCSGSINAISYYGINGASSTFPGKYHALTNCIFWNSYNTSSDEVYKIGSSLSNKFTMTFCNVRKYDPLLYPTNCFTAAPQFISSTDYHLQSTSPCINGGPISTSIPSDLDGNTRPLPALSFLDIGCYEMNQPTTTLTPNAAVTTTIMCQEQSLCMYNFTPKTKNRIWSISPGVPWLPVYKDTMCTLIYGAGNYTLSLTVADSSNAVGTSSFVITVLPSPTISLQQTYFYLCAGQSATLNSSSTGTYSSVQWNTGDTTQSIIVTPTITTTYSVTYINSYGCPRTTTAIVSYTNAPAPIVTITPSSTNICVGQTVTLTATSTGINLGSIWSTGTTGTIIVVTPTVNTIYSYTVTSNFSCKGDTSQLISVSPCTDIKGNVLIDSGVMISPNPNSGEFILSTSIKESGYYEIYNCVGQRIKSGLINEKTQISLREESSGIYFIKIFENKNLISTKKIILNN